MERIYTPGVLWKKGVNGEYSPDRESFIMQLVRAVVIVDTRLEGTALLLYIENTI